MNYLDLLKSEAELKQDAIAQQSKEIDAQAVRITRNNWLEVEATKAFVGQLESVFLDLNRQLLKLSTNSDISQEQFRILGVEVQTLSKTLNLIKNGKYD